MADLVLWFYTLPIDDAWLLIILGSMALVWLQHCCQAKLWWKRLLIVLLALWAGAVLYITLLHRTPDLSGMRFSLVPFSSYRMVMRGGNIELLRANIMNVFLFLPGGLLLGALLPTSSPLLARVFRIALLCAGISLLVELAQLLLLLGLAETDDLIHNTLGALIGSLVGSIRFPRSGSHGAED